MILQDQDYEALYFRLFNRVSDIILELQQLQQQAEEEYIGVGDAPAAAPQRDNVLDFRPPQRRCCPRGWDKPDEPANHC